MKKREPIHRVCAVCGAFGVGMKYDRQRIDGRNAPPPQWACSRAHLDLIETAWRRDGTMIGKVEEEESALVFASGRAGEYLEGLNRPGLIEAFSHMSADEWLMLMEITVEGYFDHMTTTAEAYHRREQAVGQKKKK
ncbi:DUF6511 domain-containing protein [Salipiger pacificus]|nr:DUF6511 domain-containing protein [Alloyangia pacifica]